MVILPLLFLLTLKVFHTYCQIISGQLESTNLFNYKATIQILFVLTSQGALPSCKLQKSTSICYKITILYRFSQA